jgi:hypothetical protein
VTAAQKQEGLKSARLIMVLSSISPLFILWAVRGSKLIPNRYFVAACCVMVILPNSFLFLKLWTAKRHKDRREIIVGKAEDHRDHLLVYLFAMLLPFYTTSLADWREFSATLVAVCFIVFLFWNLNLHYMNVLFAVLGYRVFTIYPPQDDNPLSGKESLVLITRRATIFMGQRIIPYRLSNSVYWEVDQ